MAETKKSTASGKAVKAEPEKVSAEVKAEASAKEEVAEAKETKAVKKEAKTTAKKAPAKKAAEKKTTAKKAVAEKAEPKAKEKKEEPAVMQAVHLQFSGKSYSTEDLQKIAADVWKHDLQKGDEAYKSVELYVKPEESIVYYVFNGDITGSFFI
ncbi:MAG: hypothetical protein HFI03_13025 [Lachnospiraceae bacterium]|nr:hypothetical protein [Lachnospiraceae bacterium]